MNRRRSAAFVAIVVLAIMFGWPSIAGAQDPSPRVVGPDVAAPGPSAEDPSASCRPPSSAPNYPTKASGLAGRPLAGDPVPLSTPTGPTAVRLAPGGHCAAFTAFDPGTFVSGGVSGIFGGAADFGMTAVLHGFTSFVAQGAAYLLGQVAVLIDQTTSPAVGDRWFIDHYRVMVGLAVLLVLPLLLASAISAIVHQDPGALVRSVLLRLPLAMVSTGIAVQLVILALAATDQLCAMVAGGTTSDLKAFLASLGSLVDRSSFPGNGAFAILLAAVVLAAGAMLICIELVIRTDAVYVAVLFLPLALAGLVWPATVRWCRRLVETLVVLILSKFVLVAVISLAASALRTGFQSPPGGDGFPALIAGTSLLLLAAFAPYALLRMVPVVEAGMIGHLEGTGRRALPSARQVHAAAQLLTDPSSLDAALQRSGDGSGDVGASSSEHLRHLGTAEDWDQFRTLTPDRRTDKEPASGHDGGRTDGR